MPYFFISNGLRGCYMPDNIFVIKCDTRKALKAALTWDARDMREALGFGGSKRVVAHVANAAWKARKRSTLDFCIPFGREKGNYPFGLFVSPASRADYLAQAE